MEVRLRLQKSGKSANKHNNYRIVAIAKSKSRDGRHLEVVGYYDPAKKPAGLQIDVEKLEKWIEKGAQMSDTVRSLTKQVKKTAAK